MGCEATITATTFPKQGTYLGRRTRVLFHYGGTELMGTIVRADTEAPWRTIIRLDDGRFVLASECQYSLELSAPPAEGGEPPAAPVPPPAEPPAPSEARSGEDRNQIRAIAANLLAVAATEQPQTPFSEFVAGRARMLFAALPPPAEGEGARRDRVTCAHCNGQGCTHCQQRGYFPAVQLQDQPNAPEWTCAYCGKDLMWCGCDRTRSAPPAEGGEPPKELTDGQ